MSDIKAEEQDFKPAVKAEETDVKAVKPEDEDMKPAVKDEQYDGANADDEGHDEVGTFLQRRMQAQEEAS